MKTNDDRWAEWKNSTLYLGESDDELPPIARRAADLGLSVGDLSIFQAIWYDYGQVSSAGTLAHNAGVSAEAVEHCFNEGFIQFLNAAFLLEIQTELDQGGYLKPRGLIGSIEPDLLGIISFTRRGVDRYMKWLDINWDFHSDHWAFDMAQGDSIAEIFATSEEICGMILLESGYVIEGPPIPTGRWCDCWWMRFERGYRMVGSKAPRSGQDPDFEA